MERPKRRKSIDNPYTLIETNKGFYISFKDSNNIKNIVEVSEKVFNAFNSFELEDKSQMNEYDRHIEHSEIYTETLYKRTSSTYESLDDEYIKKTSYEDLIEAINHLPVVVKRRIKMFYFDELSTTEISIIEGCSSRMIRKSLEIGRLKIKEYLINNKKI